MLCTNCGKDIPMAGNVCPWCLQDKSADKSWTTASYVAVGAAVAGYFLAGVGGAIAGFVAGFAGYLALSRTRKAKPPPAPDSSQPTPGSADKSVADKLAHLKQMHDQGLITAEEFANKKADLLSRM